MILLKDWLCSEYIDLSAEMDLENIRPRASTNSRYKGMRFAYPHYNTTALLRDFQVNPVAYAGQRSEVDFAVCPDWT